LSGRLVLLRHGQSTWNLDNLFTGWTDVDLTAQGRAEAEQAARLMLREGLQFDIAFTSVLRHYGALQGLDKAQTQAQHGAEQVLIWRRSYDVPPPPLAADDPRHPRFDPRYAGLSPAELPATESLKDTLARVAPYRHARIAPELAAQRNVLVVAHGNSLRALVKMLDGMSDEAIVEFNIPTGVPLAYELDEALRPASRRFLGDPQQVAAAAEAVRRQAERGAPRP
jgi:2,3-bisphosphoglycerate-dependent phosphoglycerate mutase